MNYSEINALVSMQGMQKQLDIIGNNIANVDTVGFKQKKTSFEDVLYNIMQQPKQFKQAGRLTPLGLTMGGGSKLSIQGLDMAQGSLKTTNVPTDVAMIGNGLFEVAVNTTDKSGNAISQTAWTRDGSFQLSPSGQGTLYLSTSDGYLVKDISGSPIQIPADSTMTIDSYGRVYARSKSNPQAQPTLVGQMKLVQVLKPDLLQNIGNNLYALPSSGNQNGTILQPYDPTQAAGKPAVSVRQGALEQSNVNLADQLTHMMTVQRAFQLSAQSLISSNTMMQLANNLHG